MRRLITAVALAVALTVGLIVTAAGPAGAHSITAETYQIAAWWQRYYFGPEDNGVANKYVTEVHWWGSHQVRICFVSNSTGNTAELLYDRVSGARAWLNTSWC